MRWLAVLGVGLLVGLPLAGADEVQDAVTKLLGEDSGSLVLVEFDLERIDGRGGREVQLQGLLVGDGSHVLTTSVKDVDPPVGGQFAKPDEITIRFPGDVKRQAKLLGKDEELNLALLEIQPEEEEGASADEASEEDTAGTEEAAEATAEDTPEAGDEGEEATAHPTPRPATFVDDTALVPGQQLVVLRRLGPADDDLATYTLLRVGTVIPRPGLPTEYRCLEGLGGAVGSPVFTLAGELVGFVAASTRTGGSGRRFEFIDGRLVRIPPGEERGFPTRIVDGEHVHAFLQDPTRSMRRDCWLGVKNLQALTRPLAEAYGLDEPGGIVVGAVSEKSPADVAGLEAADVIVAVDGEAVETTKDKDLAAFRRRIRLAEPGATMTFQVMRSGEEGMVASEVTATLEEAPLSENEVPEYHDLKFGLKLKPLTRDFLERSRLSIDLKGVRVISVENASWASLAGIQAGDVIRKMVMKPCENLDQYKTIMAELLESKDSEVCYNVTRSRKSLFLCVRPDWDSVVEFE